MRRKCRMVKMEKRRNKFLKVSAKRIASLNSVIERIGSFWLKISTRRFINEDHSATD